MEGIFNGCGINLKSFSNKNKHVCENWVRYVTLRLKRRYANEEGYYEITYYNHEQYYNNKVSVSISVMFYRYNVIRSETHSFTYGTYRKLKIFECGNVVDLLLLCLL